LVDDDCVVEPDAQMRYCYMRNILVSWWTRGLYCTLTCLQNYVAWENTVSRTDVAFHCQKLFRSVWARLEGQLQDTSCPLIRVSISYICYLNVKQLDN
jgi:hypothetical protein